MALISITGIKRKRNGTYDDPANSRRQATIHFTLPNGKRQHFASVWKTFLNVYGIMMSSNQFWKQIKVESTLLMRKGNKNKKRKFSKDDENLVIEHVNRFPREKRHCIRSKSDKDYWSQDLNTNRLFLAFHEKYPNSNITYRYYYETFKRSFPNIRYHASHVVLVMWRSKN